MILKALSVLLCCFVLAGGAQQESPVASIQEVPGRATLTWVSSYEVVVPGQSFLVMWQLEPAENWHLYWDGLNDSGYPPSVKLKLPPGWQVGPLMWPAPERHLAEGDILDHVYHGPLALLQEISVSADAQIGSTITIPVRIDWLACRDECVPGKAELNLDFLVGEQARPSPDSGLISSALALLPQPAPLERVAVTWPENSVVLAVKGAQALEFYPVADSREPTHLIDDGSVEGNVLQLRLRPGQEKRPLKGILHLKMTDGSLRNWTINLTSVNPTGGKS